MASITSALGRQFQQFSVLRYRNFRLFWLGLLAQVTGQQMMFVTMGWLAFHLTGSPLTLGIINLMQAIPRIGLNLVGGVLADRFDQRLLISVAQGTSAVILSAVAALTITGNIEVWHLAVASLLIALAQAFDDPSRQALFPHLLPNRSLIPAAVPVNTMAWQLTRIVAPSIAGFAIAAGGAGTSFFISAAGAAIMAMVMRMLHVNRVSRPRSGSMIQNLTEGTRYAWNNMAFRMLISLAFVTSLLTMGYQFMLPVFAKDVFGVDARGLGLLYTASGIGATFALLTVSQWVRSFPPGKVLVAFAVGFSGSLIWLSLSPSYLVALGAMLMVGYTQFVFLASIEIILQTMVPDNLRGRVMGLYGMIWSIILVSGCSSPPACCWPTCWRWCCPTPWCAASSRSRPPRKRRPLRGMGPRQRNRRAFPTQQTRSICIPDV